MPQFKVLVIEGSTRVIDVCAACAIAIDNVPTLAHKALDLWHVELVLRTSDTLGSSSL